MESIICDISGTHSRVAIVREEKIIKVRDYLTQDITSIKDLLSMYMYLEKVEIKNLVISIAGKVNSTSGYLKHGTLSIIESDLSIIGFENIRILNDFVAISYGVMEVEKFEDLIPLVSQENYLSIGAGTGLGISKYQNGVAIDNEDGHILIGNMNLDLTTREIDFVNKFGVNIEIEEILSGNGLERIYEYVAGSKLTAEEISNLNTKSSNETFDLFYSFYIKSILYFAHKYDLKQVFVAGGIIMKNMNYLSEDIKETWKVKLDKIGCRILLDYDVSLFGLKAVALKQFN